MLNLELKPVEFKETELKCRYCNGLEEKDMMFSYEFDIPVHKECVKNAIKDKDHREAHMIAKEFGIIE